MVQEDPTPCPRLDVASLYKHEFWWSHYGFLPRYHDVLHLTSKDPVLDYGISLFTKGFAHDIDSNYKAQRFDKTFEQLVQQEKILFTTQFEPQPLESREIELRLPGCEGQKTTHPFSPHFSAYHPAEYETYEVVNQVVQRFVREYCQIPFSETWMGEIPARETVCQAYKERMAKRSGKKELRMDVDSLALIVRQGEMARFPDIQHGIFGLDDNLYAVLQDGSRHLLGRPNLKMIK